MLFSMRTAFRHGNLSRLDEGESRWFLARSKNILNRVGWLLASFLLAFPTVVTAGSLMNPLRPEAGDNLVSFLRFVLSVVIALAFPAIVLFIVYAGFRYLVASAQGQPDKVKEINKTLLWAVVGALLVLGSWALVKAIEATVCAIAPNAVGCS